MEIKKGDYFVITRGRKINNEPTYEGSWEGSVFQAGEICGCMVAATIMNEPHKGQIKSINLSEIKTITLTTKYIESVLGLPVPALPER